MFLVTSPIVINVLLEELQPKDILSIDLECSTRFALNDEKEGTDLIFTGKY